MDQVALFSMCLYCHMIYESQDSRTTYVKGIIFFRSMWKESLHINACVFIYLSQWQKVFNFFIGSTKMLWLAVCITVNIDWKMLKSETVLSIFFSMKFLNISPSLQLKTYLSHSGWRFLIWLEVAKCYALIKPLLYSLNQGE
jgi:hypothetical protein